MTLDFNKLTAAIARSAAASEKLVAHLAASQPDPAVAVANQAAVDGAATALDAESVKVEAVLPPEVLPV